MLKYFCDVGISSTEGGEDTYYTKWRFRMGVSKMLGKLWSDPKFTDATKEIKNSSEMSAFIGHVLTDLNYCMDEGFQKLKEYKE